MQITTFDSKDWQKKLWKLVTIMVISMGIISCSVSSFDKSWWNKYLDVRYPEIAQVVNPTERPLVITYWVRLLSLSHGLDPKTKFQSQTRQNIIKPISHEFTDVFVYNSNRSLQDLLGERHNYKIAETYHWQQEIEPIHRTKFDFWKLTK